jgi:hypothetical protein
MMIVHNIAKNIVNEQNVQWPVFSTVLIGGAGQQLLGCTPRYPFSKLEYDTSGFGQDRPVDTKVEAAENCARIVEHPSRPSTVRR